MDIDNLKNQKLIIKENSKIKLELYTDLNDNVESLLIYGTYKNPIIELGSNLGLFYGDLKGSNEIKTGIDFKYFKNPMNKSKTRLEFFSMDLYFDIKLFIEIKSEDELEEKIPEKGIINFISFKADIIIKKAIRTNFLRFDFHPIIEESPDFIFTPHILPESNYIIGDHKLWTPTLIISKNEDHITLIGDIRTIPDDRSFKMHMDMKIPDDNRLSFGFRNYKPYGHVNFKSNEFDVLNFKPSSKKSLTIQLLLGISEDKSRFSFLQNISEFLWNHFTKEIKESVYPQVLPYEFLGNYMIDKFTTNYDGWREFLYKDEVCGGLIYKTWTGKYRDKYIVPEKAHIDDLTSEPVIDKKYVQYGLHRLLNSKTILNFYGNICQKLNIKNYTWFWNQSWFLNVRTAYGLKSLGKILENPEIEDLADRIINLSSLSPSEKGLFSTIAVLTDEGIEWIKGALAFSPVDKYNLVDIALTGYWMLKYTESYGFNQKRIVDKLKETGNTLLQLQLESGGFPTLVYPKTNENESIYFESVKDVLYDTAGSSAIGMFLCELYELTKDPSYLDCAKKIIPFLKKNVIPENKWFDYETFHSCTDYPKLHKNLKDPNTQNFPQNNMSIYWTAEFMRLLYIHSDNQEYLELGKYVLNYLSLFQQIWNPKFLKFYGFGGFGCQNTDAEWSDTRQGLFSQLFLEYYYLTDNVVYLERGIAAMKASFVLLLHEGYEKISPGNFKWVSKEDYGIIMENYGHQGLDHPVPGVVTVDWGIGTTILGFTSLREKLGDLFIDIKNEKVYGVNACSVNKFVRGDKILEIDVDILPKVSRLLVKIRKHTKKSEIIKKIILRIFPSKKIIEIPIEESQNSITIEIEH